ncbi:MAG: hypothetical protein U9R15_10805 [Chloroflexota bacterium]|nr:hypothetical protein [Chloroflexota bacterium]
MNIGTVVEGPTDRLVLQAILDKLCPGEHRYFPLQPTETFGETGTGWKGVRRWCYETWQREGASLDRILSGDTGPVLDLLVIHIDADIAAEHDLQEGDDAPIPDVQQPCPPAAATADQLERIIARWLRHDDFPSQVMLVIPAQDTESWTFAALFPGDDLCARDDYECTRTGRDHPGYCLTLERYGRVLRRTDGRIKKPIRQYRQIAPQIAAAWDTVRRICSQAERFTQNVLAYA